MSAREADKSPRRSDTSSKDADMSQKRCDVLAGDLRWRGYPGGVADETPTRAEVSG